MNLFRAYDAILTRAPLKTKTISSFFIFGLCEFNAQLITNDNKETLLEKIDDVDWRQVAGYGCLAFYNAPIMHSFYNIALKKGWSLPTRIAGNALLCDPINIGVAMILSNVNKCLCKGQSFIDSLQTSIDTVTTNYVSTMQKALSVWPIWHTVNWVLIPQRYRVLGFNFGAFIWNTYLMYSMWIINKAKSHQEESNQTKNECHLSPSITITQPLTSSTSLISSTSNSTTMMTNTTFPNVVAMKPHTSSTSTAFGAYFQNKPTQSEEAPSKNNDNNNDDEDDNDSNSRSQLNKSDLSSILGTNHLIDSNGNKVDIDSLVGKTFGLYFSASWCPPCRRFTPLLSAAYPTIQQQYEEKGEQVEMIFISADTSENEFDDYHKKMPFLSIPFKQAEKRVSALREFFQVQHIPHLVVISPKGIVVNGDAVNALRNDRSGKGFPYIDENE